MKLGPDTFFPSRQPAWLRLLLLVFAAGVLLTQGTIIVSHLSDSFHVDHVSGVWIGLAGYLNEGTLYPDVYRDGVFGGSRYMPLYFTLHAGLARLIGDYVPAGKLLSLGIIVVFAALLFGTLRRLGSWWTIAFALTVFGLTSASVWFASVTIRGDLLPVVWQLAALLIMDRRRTPGGAALAGLCCTLAVFSKLTAGWAPLAILTMTWRQDRRLTAAFLAAWLGSLAVGFLALHVLSAGRLWANMAVFSEPEFLILLLKAPVRLFNFMAHCPVLQILTPLALFEMVCALGERRLSLYHWSFIWAVPITLVIFADRGTSDNHLVDLAVLTVVLTGALVGRAAHGTVPASISTITVLAVLWGLLIAWAGELGRPFRDVLSGEGPSWASKPLTGVIPDDAVMLTEDARVDIARGRLPVVLDPYALVFIQKKHPDWVAGLVRRVQNKEFAYVVLHHRLDLDRDVNQAWYAITFGRPVSDAIRENYRFLVQAEGFCVLVPR